MKVEVAKTAGFCNGVRSAFEKAIKLAEQYGKIYTIGDLVHNSLVTEYLKSKGAFAISEEEIANLKAGEVVLIRAHGIPKELEKEMKDRGIIVYDATCPIVKRNQKIVTERHQAGDKVIIIGEKNHDEVTSVASYAGDDVQIFGESDDWKISDNPTSIVFQTTILAHKYEEVERFVEKFRKSNDKIVGIYDTICYTTRKRQDEARTFAKNYDAVLVLGSYTSANTNRLYQVAKSINDNTYFAQSAQQALDYIKNKDFQCLSIVAGASTPPWLIQEVTELMSETQMTAVENTATETEVNKEATLQETNVETAPEKELTMEDVMESNRSVGFISYKVGKRIKGTVIRADETGIFIAIGGKKDGFIDKEEATIDGNYNPEDFKANDEIEASITAVNKDYVNLSKKKVDIMRAEEAEAEKALAAGEFKLKMTEVVKGGLRGRLGQYTIFVPASQIKMGYVKNLEDYKGKTLRLTIMPPKEKENVEGETKEVKPAKKSRYLFASQRIILEKEKKEKDDLFWNNIHVHDIVVGKVKRFTEFGAFVNVRGYDCLAHISELSWNKINDPSKILTIGESYDFVVLKMDRETGKISLGFKQLQKKPYEIAAEKYPVGTIIKGKVERIFPYGAFVSISDGVDGLVHVSQISHNWIKDANESLKVGDEVEAKIIGFEENRITLSIKELLPAPEENPQQQFIEAAETGNSEDKPKVSRVKKFEQKYANTDSRRNSRKKDNSNEPKEWVSGSSSATLGDLFKNLNLNLDDEE